MKMKATLFAFALALRLGPSSLSAAVPLSWTVETSRATPATFEAYQGEALEFAAALQSYGKPLAAPEHYSFFWQTNGMGSTYWEVKLEKEVGVGERETPPFHSNSSLQLETPPDNILRATWRPEMDVGARVYNCFIGSPTNIYRAAFQLRMRPSPGALPNVLPLPQPVIDFSKVVVLNPPWPMSADLSPATNYTDAATNALDTALRGEIAAHTPGDYETVSNRAMTALQEHQSLAPATNYTDTATNALYIAATNYTDTATSAIASDVSRLSTSKADKVSGATSGDFAALDADGNLEDSGIPSGVIVEDEDGGDYGFRFHGGAECVRSTNAGALFEVKYGGDLMLHPWEATRFIDGQGFENGLLAFTDDIPEVVAPSTDAGASGKAADAKATGDALTNKLDRLPVRGEYDSPLLTLSGTDGSLFNSAISVSPDGADRYIVLENYVGTEQIRYTLMYLKSIVFSSNADVVLDFRNSGTIPHFYNGGGFFSAGDYDPYSENIVRYFMPWIPTGIVEMYHGEQFALRSDISATDETFSNAVLAVGLNIDTNSVAVLNEIAATFGDFPITGTATTVGGLLAALAAAVAWLRKHKIHKLTVTGMAAEVTATDGTAKLDDFFKESNSLLMQTMAIPFASLPADNTTSSYKRFRVTVTDDMTIVLHTPTSGDAEIFECRFDGSGLTADKSISFSTSGATATTMDTDCGTVKAGKIALMSAFWNGSTWDVNWKVEG